MLTTNTPTNTTTTVGAKLEGILTHIGADLPRRPPHERDEILRALRDSGFRATLTAALDEALAQREMAEARRLWSLAKPFVEVLLTRGD